MCVALASACGGRAETKQGPGSSAGASAAGASFAGGSSDRAGVGGANSTGGGGAALGGFGQGGVVLSVGGSVGIEIGGASAGPPPEARHVCLQLAADAGLPDATAPMGSAGMSGAANEADAGTAPLSCPAVSAVAPLVEQCTGSNGVHVVGVTFGPTVEAGQCCYDLLVTDYFCGYV